MASANKQSAGNIPLIYSDDDSDDRRTTTWVKQGTKHSDSKEDPEQKSGTNGISSRTPLTKTFEGLAARKLLRICCDEVQAANVEIYSSAEKGTEWIKLSSCQHTLLVTEKQRLEKLLSRIKHKELEDTSKSPGEINDIIESQNLKLVCENENGQLCIYFQDPSEFQKLLTLLKPNRRNRKFVNVDTFSSPAQHEPDYESQLDWRSKNAFDNSAVGSSTYLGENVNVKAEFKLNGINIKIYQGSIVRARVGAIVNAANERLDNCGGVADVIAKAAGSVMEEDCREKMKKQKKIKVSENVVTCAGNLPCRRIIHAVGPRWDDYFNKEKALEDLYKTVFNILETASESCMKSVVMPPISSGIFGVPKQACAAMYIKALQDFSKQYKKPKIKEFHFIDNKPDMLNFINIEYEESQKKGKEYLEPRNVLERLQIRPTKTLWTNDDYSKMGSNFNRNQRSAEPSKNSSSNWPQSGQDIPKHTLKEITLGEFTVDGMLRVLISTGNILTSTNVDILVCAEGREGALSGRIAKTILEKVTKKQEQKIKELLSGTKHFADVLQTEFGVYGYNMIFFAIMKRFGDSKPRHEDLTLLKNTMINVLEKANKKKNSKQKSHLSVAIPLLGTGSTKNTDYLQQFADVTYNCIIDFRKRIQENTRLRTIHLVNYDKSTTGALIQAFKSRLLSQTIGVVSQPFNAFNHSSKRSQFEPNKYKRKGVWMAIEKPECDFESCIERIQRAPKTLQKDKKDIETAAKGNLLVIESDDEDEVKPSSEGASLLTGQAEASKSLDSDYDNVEDNEDSSLTCVVCMDTEMEDPVMLNKCHHQFCRNCIKDYFSQKPICPVCNTVYGELFGNQPPGTATVYKDDASLPEFSCPTIIIDYKIPDGIQTKEHPNPDQPFTGVSRQAYLPDNADGNKVLGMLEKAFKHRLIFTVGFSRTSGKDNMVTWNDIHHKTRRDGGPEKFGYPDLEYIERVKEELAAKGITEN